MVVSLEKINKCIPEAKLYLLKQSLCSGFVLTALVHSRVGHVMGRHLHHVSSAPVYIPLAWHDITTRARQSKGSMLAVNPRGMNFLVGMRRMNDPRELTSVDSWKPVRIPFPRHVYASVCELFLAVEQQYSVNLEYTSLYSHERSINSFRGVYFLCKKVCRSASLPSFLRLYSGSSDLLSHDDMFCVFGNTGIPSAIDMNDLNSSKPTIMIIDSI